MITDFNVGFIGLASFYQHDQQIPHVLNQFHVEYQLHSKP
ncbi:hypothetical protein AAULH_02163 [Lactobacillus helveticus MTCC 5463]|nr:hypothetical protein AAULH_02163 [Lactobacillus helveticus MTCC 5463]